MLSKLQVTAFRLHSLVFFYLPVVPYPLKRTTADKHEFVVSTSKLKWLSNVIFFSLILIHGGMWGLGAVYWGFVSTSKPMSNATLACFAVLSFLASACALVAFTIFLRIHAIMSSVNDLIALETNLGQQLAGRNEPNRYDVVMLAAVIAGGLGPILTVPGAICLDLDILNYVVDEIFSEPYYRTGSEVMIIFLLRAGFLFISTVEIWRSGSIFALTALLGIDQSTKILWYLGRISSPKFPHYYNILNLIYAKIRLWFEWCVQFVYGTSFWGTVFTSFVLLTCWSSIETALYLGVFGATVVCIIPHSYVLPLSVDALKTAKDLVWFHRLQLDFLHAKKQKVGTLRLKKVGRAVRPIVIKCGAFRELDHDFLVHHFEQLCARVFDMILLS